MQGAATQTRRHFEWLLGFGFTGAVRVMFRELLLNEWKRAYAEAMRGTLKITFQYWLLALLPPAERELLHAFDQPSSAGRDARDWGTGTRRTTGSST